MWENTGISIPVKANNQERLLTSIDKAINNPNVPYQQAATYLYETGQNLDKALEYAGKALERNPKAYWTALLKAKIAAKLGRKDVAREAATTTIEIVKAAGGDADYEKSAQDILNANK
jgi:tetratricopeptide (TPR) repeat protein